MVTDTFTNTPGTQIDTHDAAWVATLGSQALTNATIQSDQLQIAAFRNVRIHRTDSQSDNVTVTLKGAAAVHKNCGVAIRSSPTQTGIYAIFSVSSGTDYTRVTIVSPSSSPILIGTWDGTIDHTLQLVGTAGAAGSLDLEVFVDGVSAITYNEAAPPTGGFDALYLDNNGGSTAVLLDDFVTVASATEITTSLVPFTPESGWSYQAIDYTLIDVGSNDSVYFGDTAATLNGAQYVFESVTSPSSIAITIEDTGYVTLASAPTSTQTFNGYVIESNGTVRSEFTFTITTAVNSGSSGSSSSQKLLKSVATTLTQEVSSSLTRKY